MQTVLLPYPCMARLFGEDPAAIGGRGKSTCFLGASATLDFTTQPVGADPPQSVTVTVAFVSFVNRRIGLGAMLGAEDTAHAAMTTTARPIDRSRVQAMARPVMG
jgi:hypothetical protein